MAKTAPRTPSSLQLLLFLLRRGDHSTYGKAKGMSNAAHGKQMYFTAALEDAAMGNPISYVSA